VLVYNRSFEATRIRELRAAVPELSAALDGVLQRMVDLLPIVRSHVDHPAFGGSYSLKAVLPALVTGLDYSKLEIADGGAAALALRRLLFDRAMDRTARIASRRALLDYCATDTLAMVRLLERLRDLAQA
jgi:predicted RecB family nuclease